MNNDQRILSNKERQVLDSYREILWLKRNIAQLENENQADELNIPDEATDDNIKESGIIYRRHINEMRSELDILTQYNKSKESIATAIDNNYYSIKAIYPEPSNHHTMEIKKMSADYINQRDSLVSEFFQIVRELDERKLMLTQIQCDIIERHVENRELLYKIRSLENELNIDSIVSRKLKDLQQTIQTKKNHLATIRAILMSLIMESGVDWESDDQLCSILTRIGEEVN